VQVDAGNNGLCITARGLTWPPTLWALANEVIEVGLVVADFVAKLDAALRTRNNRIQSSGVLNQRCALVPILEPSRAFADVRPSAASRGEADIDRRNPRRPNL
jgi:hypothetical protein